MDVIIPNLVRVLFDPAIPTSSFNLLNYFLYLLLFFYLLPSGKFMSFSTTCHGLPGPFNAGLYCQWVKLRLCPYYLVVIFCKCVISSMFGRNFEADFRCCIIRKGGTGGGGGAGGGCPPLPLKVEVATNIGNNMTFYILCTYVATNIKLADVYLTEFAPRPQTVPQVQPPLIIILCILAADIMHTLPSASKGWPKYMYMHTILFRFQVTRQLVV